METNTKEKELRALKDVVAGRLNSLKQRRDTLEERNPSLSLPASQSSTPLFSKYGSAMQARLVSGGFTQGDLATRPSLPTLASARRDYGEKETIRWIEKQINGISDFAGQGQGLSEPQVGEMASLILAAYHYLTLAEVCLFVGRFKMGFYGRFYGSVDPVRIMAALRDFIKQREEDIDRIERERHSASLALEIAERKEKAMTYEEYKKEKAREIGGGKMPEKASEMAQD